MTTGAAGPTPSPDSSELHERARRFIGYRDQLDLGEISRKDFQRFALTVGDFNPLYFDEDEARAAGYQRLVVPPLYLTSVMGWGAGPAAGELREDGLAESDSFLIPIPGLRLMGGGQKIEFAGPVLEGTRVTLHRRLEDVTLRLGRSGPLVLFTVRRDYVDASGTLLASCLETFIGRESPN